VVCGPRPTFPGSPLGIVEHTSVPVKPAKGHRGCQATFLSMQPLQRLKGRCLACAQQRRLLSYRQTFCFASNCPGEDDDRCNYSGCRRVQPHGTA
jgi:hypothetical protein